MREKVKKPCRVKERNDGNELNGKFPFHDLGLAFPSPPPSGFSYYYLLFPPGSSLPLPLSLPLCSATALLSFSGTHLTPLCVFVSRLSVPIGVARVIHYFQSTHSLISIVYPEPGCFVPIQHL